MSRIPMDDISLVYGKADDTTKQVVSNILQSDGNFIGISHAGMGSQGNPLVNIDWKAGPQISIYYLLLAINIGKKRFGETWLKSLVDQLSQIM